MAQAYQHPRGSVGLTQGSSERISVQGYWRRKYKGHQDSLSATQRNVLGHKVLRGEHHHLGPSNPQWFPSVFVAPRESERYFLRHSSLVDPMEGHFFTSSPQSLASRLKLLARPTKQQSSGGRWLNEFSGLKKGMAIKGEWVLL